MRRGRPPKDWPIETIRAWAEEGKTMRWIGEQLGTCDQHVSRLCRKHGISARPRGPRPGPGNGSWKGGRSVDADGYTLVWVADHPHTRGAARVHSRSGLVAEHRLVVEASIGRYLEPGEVVHHLNGVKSDNRLENLQLFPSNGEHLAVDLAGRRPNWTEDGRARILAAHVGAKRTPEQVERIRAGVLRSVASRRASGLGEPPSQ